MAQTQKKKQTLNRNGLQRKESRYGDTAFCSREIKYLLINSANKKKQVQNYGSYFCVKTILI